MGNIKQFRIIFPDGRIGEGREHGNVMTGVHRWRKYALNAGILTITPFSSSATYVTIGRKHLDVSCSIMLKVDFMILLGATDGSCLICLKRNWRNEHDYRKKKKKRNYH